MGLLLSTTYKKTRDDVAVERSPNLFQQKVITRETKQYEWLTDGNNAGITQQNPDSLDSTWDYTSNHAVGYDENEGRYIEIYTRTTLSFEDYPE